MRSTPAARAPIALRQLEIARPTPRPRTSGRTPSMCDQCVGAPSRTPASTRRSRRGASPVVARQSGCRRAWRTPTGRTPARSRRRGPTRLPARRTTLAAGRDVREITKDDHAAPVRLSSDERAPAARRATGSSTIGRRRRRGPPRASRMPRMPDLPRARDVVRQAVADHHRLGGRHLHQRRAPRGRCSGAASCSRGRTTRRSTEIRPSSSKCD